MSAIPKYMHWSEQEITWSIKDHPKIMPTPGGYALVLDPTFMGPDINVKFSKVLIDVGSSINIMYKDTMLKLGITMNMLEPTKTTFHGIVLGLSCEPIGKIWVDVLFGNRENCRTKAIEFEVVDLVISYHALICRPAMAKFMVTPHIAYLKMKLPGPCRVIIVEGDYKRSISCASVGSSLAESLVITQEKHQMMEVAALAKAAQMSMPALTNPHGSVSFQASKETKKSTGG